MKNYYIIIRGPLGIGKSTIAQKLAKILKAEYISIDKFLKENNLDRVNNNLTAEDYIKANNLVLPKVKASLNKGTIVIFDGCFYFKEQIEHIKKNLKTFKSFIFNLKAPLETCIERDRKRVYGAQAAKEVYELVSKFDSGIIINTNNRTEEEVIHKILNRLPKRKILAIIYSNNQKFLLLKTNPKTTKEDHWYVVTGTVKENESFEDGVKREVKEETGLEIISLAPTNLSFYYEWPKGSNKINYEKGFLVKVKYSVPKLTAWEHLDYKWLEKKDFINKIHWYKESKNSLKKILEKLK